MNSEQAAGRHAIEPGRMAQTDDQCRRSNGVASVHHRPSRAEGVPA